MRSRWSLNGNEPTPNREQRVLAHYAEVRRRKTVGQWHSLPLVAEWQMRLSLSTPLECAAIKCHSGLKARMPLNAIFIGANLATDGLCKKNSPERFYFKNSKRAAAHTFDSSIKPICPEFSSQTTFASGCSATIFSAISGVI